MGALLYMYCQTTLTRGTVQKEGVMEVRGEGEASCRVEGWGRECLAVGRG